MILCVTCKACRGPQGAALVRPPAKNLEWNAGGLAPHFLLAGFTLHCSWHHWSLEVTEGDTKDPRLLL